MMSSLLKYTVGMCRLEWWISRSEDVCPIVICKDVLRLKLRLNPHMLYAIVKGHVHKSKFGTTRSFFFFFFLGGGWGDLILYWGAARGSGSRYPFGL